MDTLALQASDLEEPIKKFLGYLRKRAIDRIKAQDFAPLAASTLEKRAQKGLRQLESKLHTDLRRARARQKGEPRGILAQMFGPKVEIKTVESRGVQNRLAVLAEFQRQFRPTGSLAQRAGLRPLTLKQTTSLGARVDRAVGKAMTKPILSGLARTFQIEASRDEGTLVSKTHQAFTDVHNKGGSAGKGAKIPQREFLKLEPEDMDVFAAILKDHLLLPLEAR